MPKINCRNLAERHTNLFVI